MKPQKDVEKLIKELVLPGTKGADERIVNDVLAAYEKTETKKTAEHQPIAWRIIMKSKMTRFAAAAVVVIVGMIVVNQFGGSIDMAVPAYAFEQTIEAIHSVRYLHLKSFDLSHEDEPKEFWFECDEFGQIENARWDMPEWDSPGDGAKTVVWKNGKASVWFKRKNAFLTVNDERIIRQMFGIVRAYDPKNTVERIRSQEAEGKVTMEIDEPSDKSEPIVVTVTYLPESPSPGRREVLFIDQSTRLVTVIEHHQLKNGEYQQISFMEFYNYNIPIDPEMFDLEKELPDDVMRVDQTTQEVGLIQGELSNEEVAIEVARQFFEALIAKDYAKAGKLLSGMPAENVQQMFGKFNCVRIISIGPVGVHPNPKTGGVIVPSVVEIETNGEISTWNLDRLGVRQVYNQPGRWTIFGGL